jgi:hypothetical protein
MKDKIDITILPVEQQIREVPNRKYAIRYHKFYKSQIEFFLPRKFSEKSKKKNSTFLQAPHIGTSSSSSSSDSDSAASSLSEFS